MYYLAFILFAVAFAAGLLGFGGAASAIAALAQSAFFLFLLASLILFAIAILRDANDGYD